MGPDNIGFYKCVVRTAQGEVEEALAWLKIIGKIIFFVFKLYFLEKPSMPQNVQVQIINDTLPAKILVSWTEAFDGNSPVIKYLVEVRTLDSSGVNFLNKIMFY